MGIDKIKSLWGSIEDELLRKNVDKGIDEMLLPSAEKVSILNLEKKLNIHLPLGYKHSLEVHEGTEYWVWLWDAVNLFSVNEVVEEWKNNIDASLHDNNRNARLKSIGPVRDTMFDKRWIPVASNNGIPICLDMNPENEGTSGQVILVDWEDGFVQVIANSFIDFLEDGLERMKR